jgi:hypothetical protein
VVPLAMLFFCEIIMDVVALIFQYLTYMISFLWVQPDWRQAISLKKTIEDKIAKGETL